MGEAVGDFGSVSDASKTLVEYWNGTGWTAQSSPNPAVGSVLENVSCVSSPEWCEAVGDYGAALVSPTGDLNHDMRFGRSLRIPLAVR